MPGTEPDIAQWFRMHILTVPRQEDRIRMHAVLDELTALRALARVDLEHDAGPPPDCAFCLGGKGGHAGHERVIHGVKVCSSCAELLEDVLEDVLEQARAAPPSDVLMGVAYDADAAAAGVLVRQANDTAIEHRRAIEAGEMVSLVTPLAPDFMAGTLADVTDQDEIEMHRAMKAQNIGLCPRCYNTGWKDAADDTGSDLPDLCSCPVGVFVAKKTGRA